MCGIVGYVGFRKASDVLLEGLKKLEYRGYDSAGIALHNGVSFDLFREQGKLGNLITKMGDAKVTSTVGIGHTRWATHGRPSERNAHPHQAGDVVVVHNGIIENYIDLRRELPKKGAELKSETDTEIVSQLINQYVQKGDSFEKAFKKTLKKLEGTYALVVLNLKEPQNIYIAKKSSPLVIGLGEKENFIASDVTPLLNYTKKVVFLENGEWGIVSAGKVSLFDSAGNKVVRSSKQISWTAQMAEKGGYKHFMLKEIMEQPQSIGDTLIGRILKGSEKINFENLDKLFPNTGFPNFNKFYMVACGTSMHSAMAGRYFMEAIAKIPVAVDTASEFRYREPFIDKNTLLLVISQSGETADTLACVEDARKKGAKIISICNVVDSSIPRHSHATLYTNAGPEIGVASTKAFTTQLTVMLMLALYFGRKTKKIDSTYLMNGIKELSRLPKLIERVLSKKDEIFEIAKKYHAARDFYFIARGVHFPIALEGALKLKEISYIHAEGYAAGEMKHGPIALLEPGTPIVALAPKDRVCEKMISNIEEVQARGAETIVIATEGDKRFDAKCAHVFTIPKTAWYITPLLATLPLQLLAYMIADLRGTDVDQPRNLAKSVTVE